MTRGGLLPLILMAVAAPAQAEQVAVDRIVAFVNNEIITHYELDKAIDDLQRQGQAQKGLSPRARERLGGGVLQRMIDEKLVQREIKTLGIIVTKNELDLALDDVARKNGMGREAFLDALAREGIDKETYMKTLENQIKRIKLMNLRVRSNIEVTRDDVKNYYTQHQDQFVSPATYKVAQIFLPVSEGASGGLRERKEAKINEIAAALKKKSFEGLAARHSEGPNAENGGLLGTFQAGELLPEMEAALKKLSPGGVSPVVRSSRGFHIFKLLDKSKPAPLPLKEAEEQIRQLLEEKETQSQWDAWLRKLRAQSSIELRWP